MVTLQNAGMSRCASLGMSSSADEGTVQKGVGNLEEARWSHKWRTINHPVPKQTLTRLSVHPEPIRSASDLVQLRVASQPLLLLRGLWLRDP
jgi:hypothetical protein